MKPYKNRNSSIQIYQDPLNLIIRMCKLYRNKKEKDKDETVLKYLNK